MTAVFSVTEYLQQLNNILAEDAVIEGEVSGFSVSQDKWVFFSLKDKDGSVLECFSMVFWIKNPIEDGMQVRVLGNPKIHEKSGRLRFTAKSILPVGEGSLKRAYELLKKKLKEEGLFSEERKRELPNFPNKIAIIASKESAAYGDFMRIFGNRWGMSEILVFPVTVQGEFAVQEITTAFEMINNLNVNDAPDVVVLTRGGGSLEDLSAFNNEFVARSVFGCKFPVVVGVGHERDESLCDFVADVRASTPSNAAERIVPDKQEVLKELNFIGNHWLQIILFKIDSITNTINSVWVGLEHHASVFVESLKNIFADFIDAISIIENKYLFISQQLQVYERILTGLNPRVILKKGYAIARISGKILKSVKTVTGGEKLTLELVDGKIESIII